MLHPRIAILNSEDADKWQGYVEELWGKIFRPPIILNEFKCFKNQFPTLDQAVNDYSLLIFGGSHYSVYDDFEWIRELERLIPLYVEKGAKIIGCCFGHQLIAKALGGKVGKNPSGEFLLGIENVLVDKQILRHAQLEDIFQSLLKIDNMSSADSSSSMCKCRFIESHGDQVVEIPPTAKVLASSASTPAEILWYPTNVLTFQFHPELTNEVVVDKIWRCVKERLTPEASLESYRQLTDILPDSAAFNAVLFAFAFDFRTDASAFVSSRIADAVEKVVVRTRSAIEDTDRAVAAEYETLEDMNHAASAKYAELAEFGSSMASLAMQTAEQQKSVMAEVEKLDDLEGQVDRLMAVAGKLNEETMGFMRELGI